MAQEIADSVVSGIPAARVVVVIATLVSGRRKIGSGYLLDGTRVLTALHCTVDDESGLPAIGLKVVRLTDGMRATVTVRESAPGLDVALLAVSGEPPWGAELPGGPAAFGKLIRDHTGEINGVAAGFPRWHEDDDGFRDVAEVHGLIRMLDGRESNRAVLRDRDLQGVTADDGDTWGGFSGAAVFHEELLLGVVIEQHPRQGGTALQFRPVGVIAEANDDASRRLARALGIDRAGALQPVPAGSGHRQSGPTGESAMAQRGWSLAGDPEAERHWLPRARGVNVNAELGSRFRGRTAALTEIVDWLRQPPTQKVLVVTGAPGVGKSAVLSRIVTTADADVRASLPPEDTGVLAAAGSVHCAVHAKGKTAYEVAAEIARAVPMAQPEQAEDLVPALRDALSARPGAGFNLVVDGIDEATSPRDARDILGKVLVPMTETCAGVGVRVVAGAKRAADGDLLRPHRDAVRVIDLDDPAYFDQGDIAAYALATLQLAGDERPGSPYADGTVAGPVAARIAELSKGNFLVAGLTSYSHGKHDKSAVSPADLSFSPKVGTVMRDYLERIPDAEAAGEVLTALAFAEAPGFSPELWRLAIQALGYDDVTEAKLVRFARSRAASFLVQSSGDDGQDPAFRLFHQALNDALLDGDGPGFIKRAEGEKLLARTFLTVGQDTGWANMDPYLLRFLPAHAARAGLVDDLLADDDYLLHADLRRVLQVANQAESMAALDRARLLGHTPAAAAADPAERAAMFSVTEALDDLGTAYRQHPQPTPYRARWAVAEPRNEKLTLRESGGMVLSMCAVHAADGVLLATLTAVATVTENETVRLWDPTNGSPVRMLGGHTDQVAVICAARVGDRFLLAAGGDDGAVRLWDPSDGSQPYAREGDLGPVTAICAVRVGDRSLLAIGGDDGAVLVWDPENGSQTRRLEGDLGRVTAICAVQDGDRTLFATGSDDGTVWLWDPVHGVQVRMPKRHMGRVNAMCAVRVGDRSLLATGSDDGTVWLWDPMAGSQMRMLEGLEGERFPVLAICEVQTGDRPLLAVGSHDGYGTVRLWDLSNGSQVHVLKRHADCASAICAVQVGGHALLAVGSEDGTVGVWDVGVALADGAKQGRTDSVDAVYAVCTAQLRNRTLLATGSGDGRVRLWDLADGYQEFELEDHEGWVTAVCAVQTGDRTLLVTGTRGGPVRLWDPMEGSQARVLEGYEGWVTAACAVQVDDRPMLVTGSDDGTVRLWDPVAGSQISMLNGYTERVNTMCVVQAGDRSLVATSSYGGAARLWDLSDGSQAYELQGHWGRAAGVCGVQVGNRTLLAVASEDGTVSLWDPVSGSYVRILEGYAGWPTAVCAVQVGNLTLLAVGSEDGTVRLLDPAGGGCVMTIPVHHVAWAMTSMAGSLAVAMRAGVLVIDLKECFLGDRQRRLLRQPAIVERSLL